MTWGWDSDWDDILERYDLLGNEKEKKEKKCECGSDAIKALRHSHWCPKYKDPEKEYDKGK